MWWIVLLFGSLAFAVVAKTAYDIARKWYITARHLPGPPVGLLGNLDLFAGNGIYEYHHIYAKIGAQYGRTFRIWFADSLSVCLMEPEDVDEVVGRGSREFVKGPMYRSAFSWFMGNGMILAEGEDWRTQRAICNPAFHYQYLKRMETDIVRTANELRSVIANQLQSKKPSPNLFATSASPSSPPNLVDVARLCSAYTLDVIGRVGFTFEFKALEAAAKGEKNSFDVAINTVFAQSQAQAVSFVPDFLQRQPAEATRANQLLRDTVMEVIRARKARGIREEDRDILAELLRAEQNGEKGMSDELLRNEVMLFMAAGNDTTSSSLAATIYLLSHHQEEQNRLVKELSSQEDLSHDTLKSLPILNAVINEALRLYPAGIAVMRMTTTDRVLPSGVKLAAGTLIDINQWMLHRDQQYWGSDATEFKPDRFIGKSHRPPHYMPFLAGSRNCIGQNLAMMELRIAIAILVTSFAFGEAPGSPVELPTEVRITVSYPKGVPVLMTPRPHEPGLEK